MSKWISGIVGRTALAAIAMGSRSLERMQPDRRRRQCAVAHGDAASRDLPG